MIRTTIVHRQNRKMISKAKPPIPAQATILSGVSATPDVTVTYDIPVMAQDLPAFVIENVGGDRAVASLSQTSDTVVVYTMDGAILAADDLVQPGQDFAVRTRSGGFVNPITIAIS